MGRFPGGKGARLARTRAAKRRARILEAFQYRVLGHSYESAGKLMGVSHTAVRRYCEERLAELAEETRLVAEQWRAIESSRLDALLCAHLPAALRGDVGAAGVVLKIIESRRKLYGLDAPVPVKVTGTVAVHEGTPAELAERAVQALMDGGADVGLLARALGIEVVDSPPALALPETVE